jgi:hypothetical protein
VYRLDKSNLDVTDRLETDALHARRVVPMVLVYIRFRDLFSWFSVSRLLEPARTQTRVLVCRAGKMHLSHGSDLQHFGMCSRGKSACL